MQPSEGTKGAAAAAAAAAGWRNEGVADGGYGVKVEKGFGCQVIVVVGKVKVKLTAYAIAARGHNAHLLYIGWSIC